jgi:hypothetical protein
MTGKSGPLGKVKGKRKKEKGEEDDAAPASLLPFAFCLLPS